MWLCSFHCYVTAGSITVIANAHPMCSVTELLNSLCTLSHINHHQTALTQFRAMLPQSDRDKRVYDSRRCFLTLLGICDNRDNSIWLLEKKPKKQNKKKKTLNYVRFCFAHFLNLWRSISSFATEYFVLKEKQTKNCSRRGKQKNSCHIWMENNPGDKSLWCSDLVICAFS